MQYLILSEFVKYLPFQDPHDVEGHYYSWFSDVSRDTKTQIFMYVGVDQHSALRESRSLLHAILWIYPSEKSCWVSVDVSTCEINAQE